MIHKGPWRRNVVLIGYRGSGKSTVGSILSEKLKVPHIDTDAEIAAEAGMSIAEIFASEGEAGFRRREARTIARAAERVGVVISAGGGAVLSDENMTLLKATGRVVWLSASPEVLFERMVSDRDSASTRPALTPQGGIDEVRAVLSQREPRYRRWANVTFCSEERSPQVIAADVVAWIEEEQRD